MAPGLTGEVNVGIVEARNRQPAVEIDGARRLIRLGNVVSTNRDDPAVADDRSLTNRKRLVHGRELPVVKHEISRLLGPNTPRRQQERRAINAREPTRCGLPIPSSCLSCSREGVSPYTGCQRPRPPRHAGSRSHNDNGSKHAASEEAIPTVRPAPAPRQPCAGAEAPGSRNEPDEGEASRTSTGPRSEKQQRHLQIGRRAGRFLLSAPGKPSPWNKPSIKPTTHCACSTSPSARALRPRIPRASRTVYSPIAALNRTPDSKDDAGAGGHHVRVWLTANAVTVFTTTANRRTAAEPNTQEQVIVPVRTCPTPSRP